MEMKYPIIILYGIAHSFGCSLVYIVLRTGSLFKIAWLSPLYLLIPSILSFIQLLLALIIFNNDLPRELYEKTFADESLIELGKLYSSAERRTREFENIEKV